MNGRSTIGIFHSNEGFNVSITMSWLYAGISQATSIKNGIRKLFILTIFKVSGLMNDYKTMVLREMFE